MSRVDPGVTAAQLDVAFPFHVLLDETGTIGRVGPSLARVREELAPGSMLLDHFAVARPDGFTFGPGCFASAAGKLVVLRALDGPFLLRGSILPSDGHGLALMSPWIRSARDLTTFGLNWDDFPPHDPTRDLLATLQQSEESLAHQRQLADYLRTQAQVVKEAHAQAARASEAKSAFLANMSHEIRTPLNGVLAALDMVGSMPLDPERAEMLTVATVSASHLLNLLNDLLDAARIDSAGVLIERRSVRLVDCHENALRIVEPLAAGRRVHIAATVDGDGPAYVLGDAMRIQQVLVNLLGNAVKFSDGGSVEFHLHLGRDTVRWTIADNGIGMSQETLARAFEPFEQADASPTRKYGGTGLGLSISRELASSMDGSINIKSAEGVGTTAHFELPVHAPRPNGESATERPFEYDPASLSTEPPRLDGLRVLLVEDNATNALVARKVLERLGASVRHVADGKLALDLLSSDASSFDVVLMDMQMPVLDGPTATRRWRVIEAERGLDPLPIVALTANTFPSDRACCMEAGMNEFLTKPISASELGLALSRYLSERA